MVDLETLLGKIGAMTPETPQVTAPVAGPGPSSAVPATAPVQGKKRHGILGAIADIVAPEAGSFWASALANGLAGAKTGQANYALGQRQAVAEIGAKNAETQLKTAQATKALTAPIIAGNNVVTIGPDGQPQFVAPPQQPDANQRLYDLWKGTTPGSPERKFLEGLGLKANAPEAIAAKGAVAASTAEARAAANERHRAPPRAAASAPALPPGFRIK